MNLQCWSCVESETVIKNQIEDLDLDLNAEDSELVLDSKEVDLIRMQNTFKFYPGLPLQCKLLEIYLEIVCVHIFDNYFPLLCCCNCQDLKLTILETSYPAYFHLDHMNNKTVCKYSHTHAHTHTHTQKHVFS